MTIKRARKSEKKVKNLRAKGLTAKQAKSVRGGSLTTSSSVSQNSSFKLNSPPVLDKIFKF